MPANENLEKRKLAASKTQDNALKYVASMEPEESLPVIIDIIDEGLKLSAELTPQTIEALKYIKAMLAQTHADLIAVQGIAGIRSLKAILKKYTHEFVENETKTLLVKAQAITITENSLKLMNEAVIWLEGLYRHTYDMYIKRYPLKTDGTLPKDQQGKYFRLGIQDDAFFWKTGYPKLEIAEYYHLAAEILAKKTVDFSLSIKEKPPEMAAVAELVPLLPEPISSQEISVLVEGDKVKIIVLISANDATQQERVLTAIHAVLENNESQQVADPSIQKGIPLSDSILREILDGSGSDKDPQLFYLEGIVREYGLSPEQSKRLQPLKEDMVAQLKGYSNKSYSIPLTKMPMPFFSRVHAQLAKEKQQAVDESANITEMLKILFDFRRDLIAQNSVKLLSKVNNILQQCYFILQRQQPENLVKARMARS